MAAFFISIISSIILNICSAKTHSSTNSGTSTTLIAILVPTATIGVTIIVIVIVCCCYKKAPWCCKQRMGVMPLATQQFLAQQQNQYAPPGFFQTTPYVQPPPYNQMSPYEKPTPYSQPIQT
ncbi:unnamed protein product [Adineta steineri]|uniref:Uncharacterized protein n=1 Tax=Adineta steineri TaxID=433720 RepID=A0A814IWD1_9BILA|nr:unnamed protein product [Adineta steineri]CAF1028058.1 unnamed protein product [Adineta steineri]CAF1119503.1 unnamed protein product [Adineta steineri]